ncbi:hypothetical protein [Streptococcus gallolyticus]|uniref:hypothetical protein n=1 Tax=Streptococcus gallolyticus TaxID=315405 RepID=UPI0002DC86A9|nr:hypothetical protein [Streptococcus gallolyticus]MCF2566401.1 hypothetical protein [Streptococcus pasteurianus]MCY7156502.1 alpha/beta hydrolase [Streptococcus gallolyticus subsp. gallolyticus]MCY7172964.1 alpha/beta hydrolase [Streptococcus gallolyticus subsp. gallolyticus]MCY7176993.1 alpha/beta hydrolase [Streptococcus gallolyticus subsp. gallolyticus]MCY7181516.1 alpha/beta hydrolase [Streptococcus gallolyticus subsp. gallolyticus]
MNQKLNNREWLFKIGDGLDKIIVLPRKDGRTVTVEEWQKLYDVLGNKCSIVIIDIPEYLCKFNVQNCKTTSEMADILHKILKKEELNNIKVFIGVSLGGMILQKYLSKYSNIPSVFISTIIEQNLKITTVFNSWKNNLYCLGEQSFNLNLLSWVLKDSTITDIPKCNDGFSAEKELLSLDAILHHGFDSIKNVSSKKSLVMYGKDSPLINMEEASAFTKYFSDLLIYPVSSSGMRVLEDNPKDSYKMLKDFIERYL